MFPNGLPSDAPVELGKNGKPKKGTPNRYGVKHSDEALQARTYDGITFGSLREMERYKTLSLRQKAGEINELKTQVRYDFIHNGQKIAHYTCDFTYLEKGELVVEDSKGAKTRDYLMRKRMMKIFHGIEIRET